MSWLTDNLTLARSQRRVLIVLLAGVLVYASYRAWHDRAIVPTEQPEASLRASELADQIDINNADWSTLAVLPSIGEKRAKDIIEHREARRAANPDRLPFTSLEELDRVVKGIGPATIAKLKPYVRFSSSQPATRASE